MSERGIYGQDNSRYTEENLEALRRTLAERYVDNELVLDIIRNGNERQIYELSMLLSAQAGSWIGAPTQVWCQVQNNPKLVNTSDAKQCSSCGKWFWKQRQLVNCTHCGTQL